MSTDNKELAAMVEIHAKRVRDLVAEMDATPMSSLEWLTLSGALWVRAKALSDRATELVEACKGDQA